MAAKKSDKDKAPKKAAATKKEGAAKSAAPKTKASSKAKAPAKGTAAKKSAKPKAAEAPAAIAPVAAEAEAPAAKKPATRPDAAQSAIKAAPANAEAPKAPEPAKAEPKKAEEKKEEAAPPPAPEAEPAKAEPKKAEEKKAEAAPPPAPAAEPAKAKRKEVAEKKPVPPPVKRPGAAPSRTAKDLLPTEEGATGFRNYRRYTAFRAPVDPGNGEVFIPEPETVEDDATTDAHPMGTAEPEVGVAPAPRVVLPPPSQMPQLPMDYGRTFVAAIVRDPSWIYVYWELASRSRRELGLDEGGQLVIRVHDVTGIDFGGGRTNDTISIPVGADAENWYVNVPRAGRTYLVELGGYDEKGTFRAVATSSRIDVPMPEVSERIDPRIPPEDPEIYTQIIRLSGLGPLGGSSRGGSEEVIRVPLQKVFEGLPPGGLSSWPWPGSETARQREAGLVGQERHRSFWLEVGVDVIVYGRTEPDAKVTFMNRPIGLTPDGRFRFRFTLPNGRFEFPIEAISPDGLEMRRVNPVVSRDTFGDPDESLPVG
jgi:hypothetical protein